MQIMLIGMHRSGTSLMTRLLNLMGVSVGNGEDLIEPKEDNPKGFWERRDVQLLHDQFLDHMGCSWFDVTAFNSDYIETNPHYQEFRKQSKEILLKMEVKRPWVIKDPRLCLFFRCWRSILEAPIVVFMWRSPYQVAKSLEKRNGFPLAFGLALWEFYTVSAFQSLKDIPVIFTSFERMFQDPMAELKHIFSRLEDNGVTGIHMPSESEVAAYVNPDLYHHKSPQPLEGILTLFQKSLVESLEKKTAQEVSYPVEVSLPVLETINSYCTTRTQLENKAVQIKKMLNLLKEKDERLNENNKKLVKSKKSLADIEGKYAKISDELVRNRYELIEKNRLLQELTEDVGRFAEKAERLKDNIKRDRLVIRRMQADALQLQEEKEKYIRRNEDVLAQLKATSETLDAVYQSRTWRWGRRLFGIVSKSRHWYVQFSRYVGRWAAAPMPLTASVQKREDPYAADIVFADNDGSKDDMPSLTDCLSLLKRPHDVHELYLGEPIDVVIPVYNGYEFLPILFEGIFKNTTLPYRLIIIHDASDDHRVQPYLRALSETYKDRILLLENKKNTGFVQSVNKAAGFATQHFVILNTDVQVPPFWLERLIWPLFQMDRIASTTPFTNDGTICSFPNFPAGGSPFIGMNCETIDWAFSHIGTGLRYFALPTGVGFCMGINKTAWDEIGPFDADTFGHGYGEENDWCMHAVRRGYRHLLVPNLYVYHKHGGSFSVAKKKKLMGENLEKIRSRHPDYFRSVNTFIRNDPAKGIRHFIIMLLTARKCAQKTTVVIDHDLGGGAARYIEERYRKTSGEKDAWIILRYDCLKRHYRLDYRYRSDAPFSFFFSSMDEVKPLFELMPPNDILINNLVTYPEPMAVLRLVLGLKQRYQPHMILCVHDYFMVCPCCTLLNNEGRYCGLKLTDCRSCLSKHPMLSENYKKADITQWRSVWRLFMENCDRVLCFSNTSLEILRTVYPSMSRGIFNVVPHQVTDLPALQHSPGAPNKDDKGDFTVGIIGQMAYHKGAVLIKQVSDLIKRAKINIRLVIIGDVPEDAGVFRKDLQDIYITGPYRREELPELVAAHGIDLAWIPSIWPETFSYTTEECIQMGLPVAVFDIGAPAERVRNYEKGIVIDQIDAATALDVMAAYKSCRQQTNTIREERVG